MEGNRDTRAGGRIGWLVLCLTLLALLVPLSVAVHKIEPTDPTVADGVFTLQYADLSSSSAKRISGIRTNSVISGYAGEAGSTELVGCPGTLRYSLDGSDPSTSTRTVSMTCDGAAAPLQSHTYTGSLNAAALSGGPANAMVTFRIEIPVTGGSAATFVDNNGGLFYHYRIDRTQGNLTNVVPQRPAGSSISESVTRDGNPAVSFRLRDSEAEAPLNTSSLSITVDGVDRTAAFDCAVVSAWAQDCAINYGKFPAGFSFAAGNHTIQVGGEDTVRNGFNQTQSRILLRVDRTPPVVTNVVATPQTSVKSPGSLPTTARGAKVTVNATVNDLSMNTNSKTTVFALLFNETVNQISSPFPMEFNKTLKKWETKDAVVPLTWPQEAFGVRARVMAADSAVPVANVGVGNTSGDQFLLDPVLPTIADEPVGPFVKDVPVKVRARITDVGSGVKPESVNITYTNVTGKFKAEPTGVRKVSSNTFEARMAREGTSDNYTYDIPAAEGGSTITFQINATDKAGGPGSTPLRSYGVDLTGPGIAESNAKEYRAKPPYHFEFVVTDAGAGVDNASAKLFHAAGSGAFQQAALALNATTGRYEARISPSLSDAQELRYYVEAKDKLGNLGNLSGSATPLKSTIDLTAPVLSTLTSPGTTSAATFVVQWSGTDTGSGIDTYSIQARVNDGTPSPWIAIADATRDTTLTFCGEGEHTYEFRGRATDRAGNAGNFPETPQSQTKVNGAGCAEQVAVAIFSPASGAILNAGSNASVRWSAASTRSFTPSTALRVDVRFSPDGVFYHALTTGDLNTGTFPLDLTQLPSCTACRVQVTARTLTGASNNATSGPFRIIGGSATADLDANGLPDSWEIRYGGRLGLHEPDEDNDGDRLSNAEESRIGTDPDNRDTDGDGASDRAESRAGKNPLSAASTPSEAEIREDQFTQWYWTVPGIFVAVAILFFVGLARRW